MIVKTNKFYLDYCYILFLGGLTSFSLPPYNYWFINFFTFSLLLGILFKNKDKLNKVFFFYGYVFGFGYFVSNLYWIPLSLSYDENFSYLIPLAIILIPSLLSLFYGIGFVVFKFYLNSKSLFINILVFSVVLGFIEFIRGNILSGFPWNLFAYSYSENIKFIQITSLIGIYGFNTILITIFSAFSILLFYKKKNELIGFFLILIITLSTYIYGTYKLSVIKNLKKEILPVKVKILSTRVPIERFYTDIDAEEVLLRLINLSDAKENEETIFIWPESIIPNNNLRSLRENFNYLFKKSFSEKHTIILGINDEEIENDKLKFFNTLSILDYEANTLYKYNKNKLVPFGEFLPLENILSAMGLKSLTNNYQSYSSSNIRDPFSLNKYEKFKILPLICYEIIYSGELSKNSDEYNFIVNVSEDGWFGDSIGPYQHFAHSVFRSVEYGKYTLRSANNGISAIVDPTGTVVDKININKEGVISLNEMVKADKTMFSTYGNKLYFLTILLYIFLIFSFKKFKNE